MKYTGMSSQVRTAILPGKLTICKETLHGRGRSQYFPHSIPMEVGGRHLVEHHFANFFHFKSLGFPGPRKERRPWNNTICGLLEAFLPTTNRIGGVLSHPGMLMAKSS